MNKTGVILSLQGGLGNQLFQYAAGRAYACMHGCELFLDTSRLSAAGVVTPREFMLDRFSIRAPVLSTDCIERIILGRPSRFRWLHSWFRYGGFCTFRERSEKYSPWPVFKGMTRVEGYFQSYKYFESYSDELRGELSLRRKDDPQFKRWEARIGHPEAVVVHVRRGDYLKSSRYHLCSPTYYRTAVNTLRQSIPVSEAFVFSDDLEWARENLDLGVSSEFVDIAGPDGPAIELALFAKGRSCVIANSTFSWWGAWRSEAPNKVVIAPKNWYTDTTSTTDLLPVAWIRL